MTAEGCALCATPVVEALLLAKAVDGQVERRPVSVEPQTVPFTPSADPAMVLHIGQLSGTDRWLVVSADDPGAARAAQMLRHPHAHRIHICDVVPAAWLDTALAGAS